MLELKSIRKEYRTGDTLVRALDGVSLTFRDNEFVAILGPSGSGKTTLLNIIGGLDHYDGGDLVINGISTKDLTEHDWDAYRNHTIGFVFQSYNLIPHLSVLSNVELALTLSGITGKERHTRALKALEEVGLQDHVNKRPNQLSGGQMQRVAIARALVNDPSIVLADEPTGALDSETSIQVMDLLQEVARDRLVIMVTHNPDLARQYATRIVTIRDGHLLSDTNPVLRKELPEPEKRAVSHAGKRAPFGRAILSPLTALSLSFHNLTTKKARTFLVSFAGSIGIIGIALILAIETGLNSYVKTMETAALTQYPLEILRAGVDVSTLLSGDMSDFAKEEEKKKDDEKEAEAHKSIPVSTTAKDIFSGVSNNDLADFKTYLESGQTDIQDYVTTIEYDYSVAPQIYDIEPDGSIEQLNPNRMLSNMLTSLVDLSSLVNGVLGETLFHALPSDPALYENDYDVVSGRWPENDHELVLVLSRDGEVSDLLLYELGIYDPAELQDMISSFSASAGSSLMGLAGKAAASVGVETDSGSEQTGEKKEEGEKESSKRLKKKTTITANDFIGRTFSLVKSSDYYAYDEKLGLWSDRSRDETYLRSLVENGQPLTIVGIVQPKEDDSSSMLTEGIAYPADLVTDLMEEERNSAPVQAQLEDPKTDILTGKKFADEGDSVPDIGKLFTLDKDEVAKAFVIDTGKLSDEEVQKLLDTKIREGLQTMEQSALNSIDPSAIQISVPEVGTKEISRILNSVKSAIPKESGEALLSGFLESLKDNPVAIDTSDFASYLQSTEGQTAVTSAVQGILTQNGAEQPLSPDTVQGLVSDEIQAYLSWVQLVNENQEQQVSAQDPNVLAIYLATDTAKERAQALATKVLEETSLGSLASSITPEEIQTIVSGLVSSYDDYQKSLGKSGLSIDTGDLLAKFATYVESDAATQSLRQSVQSAVQSAVQKEISSVSQSVQAEVEQQILSALSDSEDAIVSEIEGILMGDITDAADYVNSNMASFFTVDEAAFQRAIRLDVTLPQLQSILSSYLSGSESSLSGNLESFGYADEDDPSEIRIYAKDFESRTKITQLIEDYNTKMKNSGQEEKTITTSDVVASLMEQISLAINTVSEILIAFVAISLVVSSIMIGVITYISVLERRKEIGILRAMGASRRAVREVFNAETFLTGLFSGGIGLGITFALLPLVNHIIVVKTGESINAMLPLAICLALLALSVVLTVLSGLIPSTGASRQDPVEALRSD